MKLSRLIVCLLIIVAGISCSRDPNVVKRKYLQNGNLYFEKGKYKEASIMYRNALKKDPKFAEAYYRAGLTELKLGKPLDAARDLRRAIDSDPNHVEAAKELGDIYLAGYLSAPRPPEALGGEIDRIAKQILKKDPNSVAGLRLEGYLALVGKRDPKAASEIFRRANQLQPLQPRIVLPFAQSLMAMQQFAEAEKLSKDLIAASKTFGPIYDLLYLDYMSQKRFREAEDILKLKIENNPKQPDDLLELARFYYSQQRTAEMSGTLAKLTANPAAFPDGHARAALFYRSIRDFDSAIREFRAGAASDPPRQLEYRKGIAETQIALGKRAEASKTLDDILKENPKDDQAAAMRASLLLDTGNPQQVQASIDEFQSLIGRTPNNAVVRFNYGRALMTKGQVDQARTQFQEAEKLAPGYIPPRIVLAEIEMGQGDYGKAIESAKKILEIDPTSLPAALLYANALGRSGNTAQAREELAKILRARPNSREAALQMADLDLNAKQYKDAEAGFAKLYQADPADLRGLMGLVEIYTVQRQFDKAIQLLQQELAKNPGRNELRKALGAIAFSAGKYDLAIQQFQSLVQAEPNSADLYVHLGEIYRTKGDVQSAIRCFQKAKDLQPNNVAPYLQLGLLWEAAGRREQARPLYDQVLKLQPDNVVALNNVAYMIAESGGDLDQALTLAQRAKSKVPDNPDISDTLGWIYIKKNLSDNAVDIFRKLVAQRPDNSTYRYHLGMALFQKGDKLQAKQALAGALEKKPAKDEEAKIR
ncbi:MAG: tetratricopeptide repeat protein, partial [Bryobacteraceae bacterium]